MGTPGMDISNCEVGMEKVFLYLPVLPRYPNPRHPAAAAGNLASSQGLTRRCQGRAREAAVEETGAAVQSPIAAGTNSSSSFSFRLLLVPFSSPIAAMGFPLDGIRAQKQNWRWVSC